MATRPPAPDYSGRDYASSLTRLQRLVNSVFPQWTDFNKASFGNMLLRCMAFIVDVISKYTDFMASESLPEHAQMRRSVQAHSLWISYRLSGRTAARADVVFSLPGGAISSDIPIPAGTLVRIADAYNIRQYQLVADVTLLAGQTSVTGTVEHSENAQDIEASNGLPNQVFRLTQSPYIQDSLEVIADDGTYTQVENFLQSTSTDKHFTVEVDDEERAVVRFANGINGKIPEGTLEHNYKVGGGLDGNVEAGTIVELVDRLVAVSGAATDVAVTNPLAASGGDDPEALSFAKQQAPASLRVLNRTTAREDYEINARNVPQVATALCLTSDDTVTIREGEVVVWVLAQGNKLDNGSYTVQAPTTALLEEVEAYYRTIKPKPTGVYVRAVGANGGSIKAVNVVVTVSLTDKADKTVSVAGQPTNIGLAIYKELQEFFAVIAEDGSLQTNVDWGYNIKGSNGQPAGELSWGRIYRLIEGVDGVRKIRCADLLLNGVEGDVSLKLWEFPQLGSVLILDASDGAQLYPAV